MSEIDYSKHEDTVAAIRVFTENYESKNEAKITSHALENDVVQSGDNFCSGILRLKYVYQKRHGESGEGAVILKIPSLSMNYAELAKTNIYDNEIYVYQHLLPKLYELWQGEPFTPTFHALAPTKVLILEDLHASNFRACDKRKQLDLAHGRAALRMLAKYHAVTVKYLRRVDDLQQTLPASLIKPISEAQSPPESTICMHQKFLKVTQKITSESVHRKLIDFKGKLMASMSYFINSDHNRLTVIAHGDFWTSNILFGRDENRVKCARMVDWQLARITSPVSDLIYFFVNGLQYDIFEAHRDELIDVYLRTLNDTLSKLECECSYTRAQLDEDMQSYKYLYANLLITATPLVMLEKEKLFSQVLDEEVPERYQTFLSKWITYLDANDFI